jgi:hypothetical protein
MKRRRLPKTIEEKDLDSQLQEFDEYAHRQNISHIHLYDTIILSQNVTWVKELEKELKKHG